MTMAKIGGAAAPSSHHLYLPAYAMAVVVALGATGVGVGGAPGSYVNYHQAFLRNVTSGTNELVGSTEFTINGGAVAIDTNSVLMGRFTSNGTDSYEIQHRCSATQATNGFGAGSGNTWGNVVFTQVMLWKVA
jgi:hypothetical protein